MPKMKPFDKKKEKKKKRSRVEAASSQLLALATHVTKTVQTLLGFKKLKTSAEKFVNVHRMAAAHQQEQANQTKKRPGSVQVTKRRHAKKAKRARLKRGRPRTSHLTKVRMVSGKHDFVPVYKAAWNSLGFKMSSANATMYRSVYDCLGFVKPSLGKRKADEAWLDPPSARQQSAATYATGMGKLPPTSPHKRGRPASASPSKTYRKWPVEMKLMVIDEVNNLTVDEDKPDFSAAVHNLKVRYPLVFDNREENRTLTRGHAEAWYRRGRNGVKSDGRQLNTFGPNQQNRTESPTQLPEELEDLVLGLML